MYTLKPPRVRILIRPPPLEGYFQGWGDGGGRIRFGPKIPLLLPLTCFHASFFPFFPLCWSLLFSAVFSPFSAPQKVLCSVEERAQRRAWSSGMDLSTKLGKEIPSRNLREKRSGLVSLQFLNCFFASFSPVCRIPGVSFRFCTCRRDRGILTKDLGAEMGGLLMGTPPYD